MSAMLSLPMAMVLKCRGSGQLRPCFFFCGRKKRKNKMAAEEVSRSAGESLI